MNTILFFFAFLGAMWLIAWPLYWLISPPSNRASVTKKLEWYRREPIWPNGWMMLLFAIINSHALFPLKGAFVSGVLIASFLVTR